MPFADSVCGAATYAFGGDAGYGLLESDISSIAAIDCNDRYVKDFVGYKYSTTLAGYNRKKVSAAISVKMTVFHSVMLEMIL